VKQTHLIPPEIEHKESERRHDICIELDSAVRSAPSNRKNPFYLVPGALPEELADVRNLPGSQLSSFRQIAHHQLLAPDHS
jgi:hypothetical protein